MESISEIRHRIGVVHQTRQITRAMHMISSAKIRRGLRQYHDNEVYDQRVRMTIRHILTHSGQLERALEHPFLMPARGDTAAVLVVAGDKGLAGGFNSNVLRLARRHLAAIPKVSLYTVGHVAAEYFDRHRDEIGPEGLQLYQYPHVAQDPRLYHARNIAGELIDRFLDDEFHEVWIVSTRMVNPAYQMAKVQRILPLRAEDFTDLDSEGEDRDLIYQPSPRALIDALVPQIVVGSVFSALIQSYTSEHAARVRAMEQATKNADEYLHRLRLHLNRARQAAITQEISEIIGGVNALGVQH